MRLKKVIALLTVLVMVLAMTSCGKKAEDVSYEIEGDIIECNDNAMTIQTEDGDQLVFEYGDAEIVSYNGNENIWNGENEGDWATISYEGEINGTDTSKAQATYVYVEEGEEQIISGKLLKYSIEDASLTIKHDGEKLTFDLTYAERHYKEGLNVGDELELTYYGVINGTDTSNAYVYTVIDTDLEKGTHDKKVTVKKVDEPVWTIGTVNVRASSCEAGKIITTLKKDTKITRTGILSDGWSRVDYEGKTAYIISSALTTKEPKKQEPTKESTKETKKEDPTKETKAKPTKESTQETSEEPTQESTEEPTQETSEQPSSEEPSSEETATEETQPDDPELPTIQGIAISMSSKDNKTTMTIKTVEDKEQILEFDITKADIHIMSGSIENMNVIIEYMGEIKGDDTSDCLVTNVWSDAE